MLPLPRSLGYVAVLAALLLACKKGKPSTESSPQPTTTTPDAGDTNVGAEFEAKLNPVLEAIEKTSKKLPQPIARGYLNVPKGTVIGDNAEYIHSEDMWDLTYKPTEFQTFRVAGSGVFLSCARVVRKKEPPVEEPRKKLERCAKTEQLIVIRTKKLEEPKSHNGLQLIAGNVTGDVLVYSLPTMKLLGGFPFKAESSKQAREHEIEKDMQQNWAKAMSDGLKKLHPESKLAFAF